MPSRRGCGYLLQEELQRQTHTQTHTSCGLKATLLGGLGELGGVGGLGSDVMTERSGIRIPPPPWRCGGVEVYCVPESFWVTCESLLVSLSPPSPEPAAI